MIIQLPGVSTLVNIYSAYSFGGFRHAGVLATTSLADGVLSSYFAINKHYISLSSFWGYAAFNAVKEISSLIHLRYIAPLTALSFLTSVGIVWQGPDIFASKLHPKTLDSIKLIASFFDDKGIIDTMEQKFSEGYVSGIKYTAQNFINLLSNKFVACTLLYTTADIANLLLKQMFLSYMFPQGKLLAIFAAQNDNTGGYLKEYVKNKLANYFLDFTYNKIKSGLAISIQHDLNTSIAKLVLQEKSTRSVMELGTKVQQLPYDVESIYYQTTSQISLSMRQILWPFILKVASYQAGAMAKTSVIETLKAYSSMILIDMCMWTILGQSNMQKIIKFINKKLYGEVEETDQTEIQDVSKLLGLPHKVTMEVTPENYTYGNIQEIAKLGGNKFMLGKLLPYLKSKEVQSKIDAQHVDSFVNLLKSLVEEFSYAGPFKLHAMDQNKLIEIESNLTKLMTIFNLQEDNPDAPKIEVIKSTLDTLRKIQNVGPSRLPSNDMTLSLEDYHLGKKGEAKDMLFIKSMQFSPGYVYAITGPIGTGKTTLLSDIVKFMMPCFRSSGTIYYPVTNDGVELTEIFCGSIPFAPPVTTLFERITYRIPSEYVTKHKPQLEKTVLQLLEKFGQRDFTIEKLNLKGNDAVLKLSTGQGKLVMLISAIVYKQYLNKPTMLMLDETLANLDADTTKLVSSTIKEQFKDSIVISVDHYAEHNKDFYDQFVDLGRYVPESHDVEVMGNG